MKVHRILVTVFLVNSIPECSAQSVVPADFESFVTQVMKDGRLPGLAIAIIKDDSVVYAKGFGFRKVGSSEEVDEHTLFQAASVTKQFTAVLMGQLVERQKLKWTDPVKNYIPDFMLSEPYVAANVTIRDLLTLRCGMLGGDTLTASNREDLIRLLPALTISQSYRLSQTSYNLHYALAGYIEELITGRRWEGLVHEELLRPLGMNETYTDTASALRATTNIGVPHVSDSVSVTPTRWEASDLYAPAECMVTNVVDLSKWVRLIIRGGTVQGKVLLKTETLSQMQRPEGIMADFFKDLFNPTANFIVMGLGFIMSDYRGQKLVEMGGAARGSSNMVSVIPAAGIGVVLQTNMDSAFDSLARLKFRIYDHLLLQ